MAQGKRAPIIELPEYHGRIRVFDDRRQAGQVLGQMLAGFCGSDAVVLAIPSGGVPVAVEAASALALELELAVVSKITPPWNSEIGYGAVAFDNTVRIDEELATALGLSDEQIQEGIVATARKVRGRLKLLHHNGAAASLGGRAAILIDDGLASGFTMDVAVDAAAKAGAGTIYVAVPTAHDRALHRLETKVAAIYCPNVREGAMFAVADAYRRWSDVGDAELLTLLQRWRARKAG